MPAQCQDSKPSGLFLRPGWVGSEVPPGKRESAAERNQRRFGANFKDARLQAGLSQADISAITGFAIARISEVENGRANITLETMTRLAQAIRADIGDLLKPPRKGVRLPPRHE